MKGDTPFTATLARLMRRTLVVGVIAAIVSAGVAFLYPKDFYPAYLVTFLFWLGISLGCLAISMIHHLTGGGWGIAIRRILESGASVVLLMAVLFIPIALGMGTLYRWSDPDYVAGDEILERKVHYLNVGAFLIRAAIYFAVWSGCSLLLNVGTFTADSAVQERRQRWLSLVSGPGLILWGLAVTFAAVDWAMSLEAHWFSSMFGVLFMAGQAVSGFSLAVLVGVLLLRQPASPNVLTGARLHDLGNFLLAFVMFWSYVSFMQFLIIWEANLPEETPWYLRRREGGWQYVVGLLMVMHFLVPFLLLLARQVKRNVRRMLRIAMLLLVMRFVDLCWIVLPTFSERFYLPWPLLVTMPAVGGLWLAAFTWRLSVRGPLIVHEVSSPPEASDALARPATH
jgi:hypothetical protein